MPRREKPLDSLDSALGRFAADLRRLREKAGRPTYRELSKSAHFSTTVLSEAAGGRKLPSLAVTLAYVGACAGDSAEWRTRWHVVSAELAGPHDIEVEDRPVPYVGLSAFQAGDADRFFGREQLVEDLLTRVRDRRFLGVFGASGSGKSSVLRAGLVARAGDHRVLVFTPGPHPLEECAVQMSALTGESAASLRIELAADSRNFHLCIRQALLGRADLLLVVDQFEEVFTLCRDEDERAWFVRALVFAATAATSRVRVVLGVRADFYGHCGQHLDLIKALGDAQVLVGPMTVDELQRAITTPAVRTGYTVETALVSRLIADAAGQPTVLPLVSHALLETWRRRRGTRLTLAGYEETGGIQHAVARSAEEVHAALDEAQQDVAKQIFLRLTAVGDGTEDTKRRLSRHELDNTDPNTAVVLERLAHARLITLDRDSIEITHEALIRCWPRLRDWLADDHEGRRVHRQLTDATEAWEALDHDLGAVYRGTRLAVAQDWVAANGTMLTPREQEFMVASTSAEVRERSTVRRRTRRLRQLVAVLVVLLMLAAGAVVTAVRAETATSEQRDLAFARRAISDANTLRGANPALARQLSVAAYRLAPIPETLDTLLSMSSAPYASRLTGHTDTVRAVAFSADGRTLATAGNDRTARLWDVSDSYRPKELATLIGHGGFVESVGFSSDGRTLATGSADKTARLWDITDPHHPQQLAVIDDHAGTVNRVAFSSDRRLLATASSDRTARLWDLTELRHPRRVAVLDRHTDEVTSVAFSPDSRTLATGSIDGTARLWDVTDLTQLAVLDRHPNIVSALAFSPDGHTLATSGGDQTARLWDVRDVHRPQPLGVLVGHSSNVWALSFSPDSRRLATASSDNTARIWDVANPGQPRQVLSLLGHTNNVWGVAFSSDGHTVATVAGDRTARLHDLSALEVFGHTDVALQVVLSRDGRTMATASGDRTVRLWDTSDVRRPRALATLNSDTGAPTSMVFSRGGDMLVVGNRDHTPRLWDITDPRRPREFSSMVGHTAPVDTVDLSPDGTMVATGSDDRTVRLWDVSDRLHPKPVTVLPAFGDGVDSVAFSPDGRTLGTGSNGDLRLWDMSNPHRPEEMARLTGQPNATRRVVFNPDGHTLAAGGGDNTARLWDVSDPRRPQPLATLSGHTDDIYSLAFSFDGDRLVTVGADRSVRLWDISTRHDPRPVATLTGHAGPVHGAAFTPDHHTLLSTAEENVPRVWDLHPDRAAARICDIAYPRITRSEWDQYFPTLDYQPPCP